VATWRLAAPRRFAEPGVTGRPATTFAVVSAPFAEEPPPALYERCAYFGGPHFTYFTCSARSGGFEPPTF